MPQDRPEPALRRQLQQGRVERGEEGNQRFAFLARHRRWTPMPLQPRHNWYYPQGVRGRTSTLLTVLFFALFAGTAGAAQFDVAPPPTSESGAGPFTFWISPTEAHGTAYLLPGETAWHRCQSRHATFTLSNLPPGTYTITIADDVTSSDISPYNGYARGPCQLGETDAPDYPPSTFTLTIAPPAPSPAATPVNYCAKDKAGLATAKRRLARARTAYRRHHTATRRRARARALRSVKRWQALVAKNC